MITLMALLAKEAVENIKEKQKAHLKNIFKKIEEEIQKDDTLKKILIVSEIDDLEKLSPFIKSKKIKEELQKELSILNIDFKDIKISLLNSAKELNKKIENIENGEYLLYFSLAAFKEGEKISGKIIKSMLQNNGEEKEENSKVLVYEVDVKNNQVRENSLEKLEKERIEEEIRKKKLEDEFGPNEKNPDIGMPRRGNPGISGPGL